MAGSAFSFGEENEDENPCLFFVKRKRDRPQDGLLVFTLKTLIKIFLKLFITANRSGNYILDNR